MKLIIEKNEQAMSESAMQIILGAMMQDKKVNISLTSGTSPRTMYKMMVATVYKGNIIKNLIMDCQSYTKYRPNETTGGIFVSWRRKEELPTGA